MLYTGFRTEQELLMMTNQEMEEIANRYFDETPEDEAARLERNKKARERRAKLIQEAQHGGN